ncbi:hypothetical protein [Ornithinibacillus contaminans]|uniref:hypothetical protein n=1 Tax=Ornithinibacillus contaminans TaxID=694055 RepID=UPI00064DF8F1|nr:hypothetical protein [Ornithinibacillus contaminans]
MIKSEFQKILQVIDRKDIADEIKDKFSMQEQEQMYEMFRNIMSDEIAFVMVMQERQRQKDLRETKQKEFRLIEGGRV